MVFFSGNSRSKEGEPPPGSSPGATLDAGVRYKVSLVRKTFRLVNLNLLRSTQESENFLLDFELERVGFPNSGKSLDDTSKVNPTLSFIATGREIQLFSGLLGRECQIEEERTVDSSKIEDLEAELQRLREALNFAEEENRSLKTYFMESQRPRRIS